jgi:type IV secretion system protein VirB4
MTYEIPRFASRARSLLDLIYPQAKLHEMLPWRFMWNPYTVGTRVGKYGLMASAFLTPRDIESISPLAVDAYHWQVGELLGRFGDGWTLFFDKWHWRRPIDWPQCDFGGCIAAQRMDAEERQRFAAREAKVFDDSNYLTFSYNATASDRLFEWMIASRRRRKDLTEQAGLVLDRYDEVVREALAEIEQISSPPKLLTEEGLGSYLAMCVNYEPWPAFVPSAWIAEELGTATWLTGLHPQINRQHVRTVEVFGMGALTADTLRGLHDLDFEFRWCLRMEAMDRDKQASEVSKLIGHYQQKRKGIVANIVQWFTRSHQDDTNLTAVERARDAEQLKIQIEMAELGYARITCNVHTWHADPDKADEQAERIETYLKGRACTASVAKLNATGALLSDIPGNWGSDREVRALIAQITRLAPITGVVRGARFDAKWKGPALLTGLSRQGLPIYFNFHSPGEDLGNTVLLGQSGSGKSMMLARMAAAALKYENAKVLFFDRHGSFIPACLCMGGDLIRLGGGFSAVQPLRNIHNPEQFLIAHEGLCRKLQHVGTPPDTKIRASLAQAMTLLARHPPDARTMTRLVKLLGGSKPARDGLARYCQGEEYGEIFDGVVPSYGKAQLVGIECASIMGQSIAPLVIADVFTANRFERMHTGDPFVVIFDEAQAMLIDDAFAPEIDFLAREIRKAHGVLVLASQSQSDFMRHTVTRAIWDQMKNRIYLPDPNAADETQAQYMREAGLEEAQIEQIAHGRQKGDYFIACPQYKRLVQFRYDGETVDMLGNTQPEDRIRALTMHDVERIPSGEEFRTAWLAYCQEKRAREEAQAA